MHEEKFPSRTAVSDEEESWPEEESFEFRPPGPPAGLRRVVNEIYYKWQGLNEPDAASPDAGNHAIFRDRPENGNRVSALRQIEDEHYLNARERQFLNKSLAHSDPDSELLRALWRVVSERTTASLHSLREAREQLCHELELLARNNHCS